MFHRTDFGGCLVRCLKTIQELNGVEKFMLQLLWYQTTIWLDYVAIKNFEDARLLKPVLREPSSIFLFLYLSGHLDSRFHIFKATDKTAFWQTISLQDTHLYTLVLKNSMLGRHNAARHYQLKRDFLHKWM